MKTTLFQGDCLEVLDQIPDGVVDLCLTDPPYGTTHLEWDCLVPLGPMWDKLNRVLKKDGATILFSKQPFTTILNNSRLSSFKQELIWVKNNFDNPMMAKRKHLNIIENLSIFYDKQPTYFPQGLTENYSTTKQGKGKSLSCRSTRANEYDQEFKNYPKNVLYYDRDTDNLHPTQKPVALLSYLIKTYTRTGETVLDFTMGSGSTGVAAKLNKRSFIGIEKDLNYFNKAKKRIEDVEVQEDLFSEVNL